jgi:hypothetical protein
MTKQITLQQALELVDFDQYHDGTWYVTAVKGDCGVVKGYCGIVKGQCHTVEGDCIFVRGYCSFVKNNCGTVEGNCGTVKGNCHTVEGHVLGAINGRQWQYVEALKEKMARLIKEGASKEELLEALEEL